MSFFIKGKMPAQKAGVAFHRTNWEWRPIAEFLQRNAPTELMSKIGDGIHYNDGAGLNKDDAVTLALEISKLSNSGMIDAYLAYRKGRLVTQPDGTYADTDSYRLRKDDLLSFRAFLLASGGFEIW